MDLTTSPHQEATEALARHHGDPQAALEALRQLQDAYRAAVGTVGDYADELVARAVASEGGQAAAARLLGMSPAAVGKAMGRRASSPTPAT